MNVIVDTNVFASGLINPKGIPRKIINYWKTGRIKLCLSQTIVDEYVIVLKRLKIVDQEELEVFLRLLAQGYNAVFTHNTPTLKIVDSDPDDDKFFECAVALKAEHIISGDKAVLAVERYFNIEVVTPKTFVERMASG